MTFKFLASAALATLVSLPALAGGIMIKDPYARSGPRSGAAFFTIMNHSDTADRLIAATSDAAPRIELHTHIMENGIAKMREVEGGFAIEAHGSHALARGGDHVMFMGLDKPFEQGSTITVTLTFEQAGDMVVQIPVDNERKGPTAGHGDHSHKHDH
jgi:copper(I)-binding protein